MNQANILSKVSSVLLIIIVLNVLHSKGHSQYDIKHVLKNKPELFKDFREYGIKKYDLDKYGLTQKNRAGLLKAIKDILDTVKDGSSNTKKDDSYYSDKGYIKKRFNNKILVKRLIPHGFESKNHFSHEDSYYNPVVRIHGLKPRLVFKTQDENRENVNNNFALLNKLGNFAFYKKPNSLKRAPSVPNVNKDNFEIFKALQENRYTDEELLEPFNVSKKPTFYSILQDIKVYLGKLKTQEEVRRLKYAVLGLLENHSLNKKLRSRPTKSEEKRNPGLTKLYDDLKKTKTVEKKKIKPWRPNYAFWNYWMYDKQIYQDDCKGKLIQQGHLCIEKPPH